MSNDELSRRDALGNGAAALVAGVGAALAVSAVGRDAEAQTNPGDAAKLNTLLRAEYDAILTYGVAATYLMNPDMTDAQRAIAPKVLQVAQAFAADHGAHAARLATLITTLGGTPLGRGDVPQATLPMGFRATVLNILKLGANKERAASIAYADTLKTVSTATAAELVAAIGGVETMHFTVLYLAAKNILTPNLMDMMAPLAELAPKSFVALSDTAAGAQTLRSITDLTFTP